MTKEEPLIALTKDELKAIEEALVILDKFYKTTRTTPKQYPRKDLREPYGDLQ